MFSKIIPWIPVVAWASLIFTLSSLPSLRATEDSFIQNLINIAAHFFEYFVFTALLINAFRHTWGPRRALLGSAAVSSLYSLSDEIHQLFVPGRLADPMDILVDLLGTFTCLFLVQWTWKGRKV